MYARTPGYGKGKGRGNDKEPTGTNPLEKNAANKLPFACHFYLYDRHGHASCRNFRFTRISDLKQHLIERVHPQPLHCPICGHQFGHEVDAQGSWNDHIRARRCIPQIFYYPGVTTDDANSISELFTPRLRARYSTDQRWYKIWDILFPGAPHPERPYLTVSGDDLVMRERRDELVNSGQWYQLIPPGFSEIPPDRHQPFVMHIINTFVDPALRSNAVSNMQADASMVNQASETFEPFASSGTLMAPSQHIVNAFVDPVLQSNAASNMQADACMVNQASETFEPFASSGTLMAPSQHNNGLGAMDNYNVPLGDYSQSWATREHDQPGLSSIIDLVPPHTEPTTVYDIQMGQVSQPAPGWPK